MFTSQTLKQMIGTLLYEIISLSRVEATNIPVSFTITAGGTIHLQLETGARNIMQLWGESKAASSMLFANTDREISISQDSSRSYCRLSLSCNAEHPLLGCDLPCRSSMVTQSCGTQSCPLEERSQ
jgi:hypothetical protein